MTLPDVETAPIQSSVTESEQDAKDLKGYGKSTDEYLDDLPDEVEMSLFDHLEELRQRIFYALIAVVLGVIGCFVAIKPIVQLLEVPAHGVKFLQLAPGEYFLSRLKWQDIAAY